MILIRPGWRCPGRYSSPPASIGYPTRCNARVSVCVSGKPLMGLAIVEGGGWPTQIGSSTNNNNNNSNHDDRANSQCRMRIKMATIAHIRCSLGNFKICLCQPGRRGPALLLASVRECSLGQCISLWCSFAPSREFDAHLHLRVEWLATSVGPISFIVHLMEHLKGVTHIHQATTI